MHISYQESNFHNAVHFENGDDNSLNYEHGPEKCSVMTLGGFLFYSYPKAPSFLITPRPKLNPWASLRGMVYLYEIKMVIYLYCGVSQTYLIYNLIPFKVIFPIWHQCFFQGLILQVTHFKLIIKPSLSKI